MLPKTNAYGGFVSSKTSTISAIISNTVGYENKASNVGLILVDGIKAAVAKKGSLSINQSATSISGAIEKGQSARLEEGGSSGAVDRHRNKVNSRN